MLKTCIRWGNAGRVEVSVDGQACGRETIPLYLVTFASVGVSVGEDHRSAVSAPMRPQQSVSSRGCR